MTQQEAAEVIRSLALHVMDTMAIALPADRWPPLSDDEWHRAEVALADAGIGIARLTAHMARRIAAEQILGWVGAADE